MIDFDSALARIRAVAVPLGSEHVDLMEAAGRIAASDIPANRDHPLTPQSVMDGYAVGSDCRPGDRLAVQGEAYPGSPCDTVVGNGAAARVFTGAPLPSGTARVVMQENVDRDGDVAVIREISEALFVRRAGTDFRAGDVLVPKGTRLGPRALVAAAAGDHATLEVMRRPRVTIITTGDELVPPGDPDRREFQIPDSLSVGLAALLGDHGATVDTVLRLDDRRDAHAKALRQAVDGSDLLVVAGGASVGERDFAKAMLEPLGLDLAFSKVAMKPGKPVWFGQVRDGEVKVLGLPGNPTSALVTARLLGVPLLRGMTGAASDGLDWQDMSLATPLPATGGRETFWRARVSPEGLVPITDQDSGLQRTLVQADMLIRRRGEAGPADVGETVEAIAF